MSSFTDSAGRVAKYAAGQIPMTPDINGGTIDGAVIGGATRAAGSFTTVSATGQITSTVTTGTAPLVIASTTAVANLNASLLLGGTWAAPGAIGSGTPSTGAFTTITATGTLTAGTGSTIGTGTGTAQLILSGGAGSVRDLVFHTGAGARWIYRVNSVAESGSDAGSNFEIQARTDVGGPIDTPLTIIRAAGGAITLARPVTITGDLAVNGGDITTTAATATVFNSGATTLNIGGAATQITLGPSGGTLDIGALLEFNGGSNNTIRAFGGRDLVMRLGSTGGANQLQIRDSGFNLVSSCTDVGAWTMTGLTVTGNSTFGDATTDTFTFVGRMIVRSVTDAGPMTATAGSAREIVFNTSDSKFYGCTVAGSPATWAAFH